MSRTLFHLDGPVESRSYRPGLEEEQNVYQSLDQCYVSNHNPDRRGNPEIPYSSRDQRTFTVDDDTKDLRYQTRTELSGIGFNPGRPEAKDGRSQKMDDLGGFESEDSPHRCYPPPAKFFPGDSWQMGTGNSVYKTGLRRVSLPDAGEEPCGDGARAVYFNDAVSPPSATVERGNGSTAKKKRIAVEPSDSDEDSPELRKVRQVGPEYRRKPRRHESSASERTLKEKRWTSEMKEGNLLLDDRALQTLLENVDFELDRNFVEPVELRTYSNSLKSSRQDANRLARFIYAKEHSRIC